MSLSYKRLTAFKQYVPLEIIDKPFTIICTNNKYTKLFGK